MTDSADRLWFRSKVLAWSAGLLDEEEEQRFTAMHESDAECRAVLEAFMSDLEPETTEHIPNSLLARWPETTRTITGLERELYREHLAGCEACRDNLRLLGFEPRLDDAIEPRTMTLPGRVPERRFAVRHWLVAAAAVIACLLFVPTLFRDPTLQIDPNSFVVKGESSPPASRRPALAADGWTLVVPVPSSAGTRLGITISDQDSKVIFERLHLVAQATSGDLAIVEIPLPRDPLKSGARYRVAIYRVLDEPTRTESVVEFDLIASPPR